MEELEVTPEMRRAVFSDIARQRSRGDRVCGQCGATFTGRAEALYCSNRCRTAHNRAQRKVDAGPAVIDTIPEPR